MGSHCHLQSPNPSISLARPPLAGWELGLPSEPIPRHQQAQGCSSQITGKFKVRGRRQEQSRTLVCSRTSLLQPHSQLWEWSHHLWECGRSSVLSPTESFAGKRLFSPQNLCLAFYSCGFGIPLPAVTADSGSSPWPVPALLRRSSCRLTWLKTSPPALHLCSSGAW